MGLESSCCSSFSSGENLVLVENSAGAGLLLAVCRRRLQNSDIFRVYVNKSLFTFLDQLIVLLVKRLFIVQNVQNCAHIKSNLYTHNQILHCRPKRSSYCTFWPTFKTPGLARDVWATASALQGRLGRRIRICHLSFGPAAFLLGRDLRACLACYIHSASDVWATLPGFLLPPCQ